MTETPAKTDVFAAGRELIKRLEADYPVFKEASPLAIGIDKQVFAALPDLEKKILRAALRGHTQTTRYLKSMEKATVRFNLDGSEADAVTDEMRAHASGLLKERFKKKADARRAQEAAAKAEQIKQEKLTQLAAKFGRK